MTLLTIAMMAIAFVVSFFAIGFYCLSHKPEWTAKKLIKNNLDLVFHIELINTIYDIDAQQAFCKTYEWLREQPEIKICGVYIVDDTSVPNKLYVSDNLLELVGIHLQSDENKKAVYVGINLQQDYIIGDLYYDDYCGDYYEIIDYLPEKSLFMEDAFSHYTDEYLKLDNYLVINFTDAVRSKTAYLSSASINNFYYVLNSDVDKDAFTKKLVMQGKEYGIDLYGIHSLPDMFRLQRIRDAEQTGQQLFFSIYSFVMCGRGVDYCKLYYFILKYT